MFEDPHFNTGGTKWARFEQGVEFSFSKFDVFLVWDLSIRIFDLKKKW